MKDSNTPNNKPLHWADQYAERVVREKGEKDLYTAASGITPSGTVHIGNFREIISVDLVVRALRDRGKKVRFIYSWDDFDVFRKVPKNMPKPEVLEAYLRFPIDFVPDTTEESESYARHNELEVEKTLPIVGIYPEYIYQSKQYRQHVYAKAMRETLLKKEEMRKALDEYRTEPLSEDWMPISQFCEECQKDTTKVTDWDGDWHISYECSSCGNKAKTDLRETSLAKLPWRLDWPMRWVHEGVDFEPAGKDHHSEGGSFDTSRLVVAVYGGAAPTSFQYDFLSIKGRGGKISSSSGEVVSLPDVLEVYTPEVTRYLFASTRPNAEFAISFDLDVLKIYEDYDKTQRIYYGILEAKNAEATAKQKRIYELSQANGAPEKMPYDISFRHLTTLAQIFEGDAHKVIEELGDVEDHQKERLAQKIQCAFAWVRNFAPEDFKFALRQKGESPNTPAIKDLVSHLLENKDKLEEKELNNAIYNIARENGMEPVDFFKVVYVALIEKEQGPKLARFIMTLGVDRVVNLLS